MISVNDLKTGLTLELDNGLWSVVEFMHVKPGKGAAFVRTKLKNVETGNVVEKTFRAGEKVAKATLDKREMQYLYKEGEDYVMMDTESYEQLAVTAAHIGDGIKYLKENMNVNILLHDGKIIGLDNNLVKKRIVLLCDYDGILTEKMLSNDENKSRMKTIKSLIEKHNLKVVTRR